VNEQCNITSETVMVFGSGYFLAILYLRSFSQSLLLLLLLIFFAGDSKKLPRY